MDELCPFRYFGLWFCGSVVLSSWAWVWHYSGFIRSSHTLSPFWGVQLKSQPSNSFVSVFSELMSIKLRFWWQMWSGRQSYNGCQGRLLYFWIVQMIERTCDVLQTECWNVFTSLETFLPLTWNFPFFTFHSVTSHCLFIHLTFSVFAKKIFPFSPSSAPFSFKLHLKGNVLSSPEHTCFPIKSRCICLSSWLLPSE